MGAAETIQQEQEQEALPALLLVDDHHVTAEIERNYFASVGFRVHAATTATDVEQIVKTHDIDLMIIDLNFSKEQGLRTLQVAKKVSRNPRLKAIVTSVVGLPALRKTAYEAGADEFLVKPAPRPKVLKEIKKLTSQKTRDTERVKQSIELAYLLGGTRFVARTLDLSGDGVHLSASHLPEDGRPAIGSEITLSIILGKGEKALQVPGTVVRHTAEGFGVKFGDLGRLVKRQLDKYLLRFSMEHKASQYYL